MVAAPTLKVNVVTVVEFHKQSNVILFIFFFHLNEYSQWIFSYPVVYYHLIVSHQKYGAILLNTLFQTWSKTYNRYK